MANPRKFSEKIALQKQKQAEGTAEFERIMKEVYATKMDETQANQKIMECCLVGEGAVGKAGCAGSGGASPDGTAGVVGGGCNSPNIYRESRGRSVGVGPMRRPSERKQDRSPYGSSATNTGASSLSNNGQNIAYLSPPIDSSWRRSNSDSALHQSLNTAVATESNFGVGGLPAISVEMGAVHPNYQHHNQRSHSPNIGRSYSPQAQRKGSILQLQQHHHQQQQQLELQLQQQQHQMQQQQHQLQQQQHQPRQHSHQQQSQPPSQLHLNAKFFNCNMPANNIFKTLQEQALATANTGSLPDLTSVRYATPSQQQLMHQQQQQTLSPVMSPLSNTNSRGDRDQSSSPFSPGNCGEPPSPFHQQQHSPASATTPVSASQASPHLSFTNLAGPSARSPQQAALTGGVSMSYVHLPTLGAANSTGNLTDYRQPLNPPSPGSSPGLLTSASGNDIHSSAPSSPARHPQKQTSLQQQQQGYNAKAMPNACQRYSESTYNSLNHSFHNHFEQFSLGDSSSSPNQQRQHFQQQQSLYASLEFENFGVSGDGSAAGGNNGQQQAYTQTMAQNKLLDFNCLSSLTGRSTPTSSSSNSEVTISTIATASRACNSNSQHQRHPHGGRTLATSPQHQQQLLNNNSGSTNASPTTNCRVNNNPNNFVTQQNDASASPLSLGGLSSPSSPLPIPISTHNHVQQQSLSLSRTHSAQHSPMHSPLHSPHNTSPISASSPGLSTIGGSISPPGEAAINVSATTPASGNQQSQQHGNATPTSATIPSIIFSDYSSNSDFSREIFDTLDLDLGQMDVAGLQMLSDPSTIMIADPTIEDSFRRDLN